MNSFYALIAVGLDAARIAFSKSKIEKKAVSAVAAAVVGVGLLCLPIESVQANHGQSSVPIVSEVIVDGYDFFSDGFFDMEVVHSSGSGAQWATPKYCWSGVIYDPRTFQGPVWRWVNAEDYSFVAGLREGFHSEEPEKPWDRNQYYHPAYLWEYYICKIVAKKPGTTEMDKSFGWVEVWFFAGGIDPATGEILPPSVSVQDSEGNWYYPTLTIR